MELHIQQYYFGAGRVDRRSRHRVLLGYYHHGRRVDYPFRSLASHRQLALRPRVW